MLIDADVLIWVLRDKKKAIDFLDSIEEYHISDITYMEVMQGTKNKQEMRKFTKMIIGMEVKRIPIDTNISAKAVELVESYAHSHSVHSADSLVAATALVHNLTVATGNIKHFSPIPELEVHPFSPV